MYNQGRKKIRGLKRKHILLKKRISQMCAFFPNEEEKYWHMSMPCSDLILDYPKVRRKYKINIVRFLIDQTEHLNSIKPTNRFAKTVCCLPIEHLWNAQIIIFFDEDYYETFFNRKGEYQKWTEIDIKNSIKKHGFVFNDLSKFRGYHEVINDDEDLFEQDIWFFECE